VPANDDRSGTFEADAIAEVDPAQVDPEEVAASMRSAVSRLRAQFADVYNIASSATDTASR
jgi:hypothetical protein